MTRRKRVYACRRADTYKYFLDDSAVARAWQHLEQQWGPAKHVPGFDLRELATPRLLLRAPSGGTPVTVLRTSTCSDNDIEILHRILEYAPRP